MHNDEVNEEDALDLNDCVSMSASLRPLYARSPASVTYTWGNSVLVTEKDISGGQGELRFSAFAIHFVTFDRKVHI